jgi:hypothetical protein
VRDDKAILPEVRAIPQRETGVPWCGGIAEARGEVLSRGKYPYNVGWTSTSL